MNIRPHGNHGLRVHGFPYKSTFMPVIRTRYPSATMGQPCPRKSALLSLAFIAVVYAGRWPLQAPLSSSSPTAVRCWITSAVWKDGTFSTRTGRITRVAG